MDVNVKLARHVLAMSDDAHFIEHPEWPTIVADARVVVAAHTAEIALSARKRNLSKVVLIHWPTDSSSKWLVEITGKDGSYSPIFELTKETMTLLDNLSAVRELIAAAKSWHEFHHGSDDVQCDDICKALRKLKAVSK